MVAIVPFLFSAGSSLLSRQAIKKGIGAAGRYVGKKRAQSKAEALKKTRVGEKGLGAFQKVKNYTSGAGLSSKGKWVPVKPGGVASFGRGTRDLAQMGFGVGPAVEGVRSAAPLFTDEDMTTQNYANILAAALRIGRAALQRQAPGLGKLVGGQRGEKFKTRYKTDKFGKPLTDKKGKKIPMKDEFDRVIKDKYQLDMDPKTARQDMVRSFGTAGIYGAVPFVFGGDNAKATEYPDTKPGEAEIKAQEEFTKQTEPLRGPEVKKTLELIEKRKGFYTEDQQRDMLREAIEKDKVQEPKEDKGTDETIQTDQGGQPPKDGEEQTPVVEGGKPPESPGTGAANETDIDVNAEQAIESADSTAKTITNPKITPPNIVSPKSPSDVFLAADVTERDYSAMQDAMTKYSEFIESEEGKVLNYKEYIKRFKDMTGEDDQAGNIALFKWGMAMMTGRSNQHGLAGFMDIAGTAGLSLGEDLMAINERQREENRALAGSFLAYEQDAQKYLSGLQQQELQQLLAFEEKVLNDKVADEDRVFRRQLERQQIYLQKMQIMREIQDKKQEMMKAGKLQTVIINDPTSRFKIRKVEMGRNDQGNLLVIDEFVDGVPTNRLIKEEEQDNIVAQITNDPTRAGKFYNRLEAINTGLKFTKTVRDISEATDGVDLGSRGYFDNVFTNIGGLYREWTNNSDVGLGGRLNNISDDQQVRAMINETYLDQDNLNDDERDEYKELVKGWNKDKERASKEASDIMKKGLDSSFVPKAIRKKFKTKSVAERQKIVRQLAQLRLIENRMKYIVANANKGEDRLTVADVKDAATNTNIFGLFDSGEKVAANYAELDDQLNQSYDSLSNAFIMVGGNESQLDSHKNTRNFLEWQAEQSGTQNQGTKEADVNTLIDKLMKKK